MSLTAIIFICAGVYSLGVILYAVILDSDPQRDLDAFLWPVWLVMCAMAAPFILLGKVAQAARLKVWNS